MSNEPYPSWRRKFAAAYAERVGGLAHPRDNHANQLIEFFRAGWEAGQADESPLFRLKVESVGDTKEAAIRHALKVIGGILAQAGTDYSCGSTTGGARAEWEEL